MQTQPIAVYERLSIQHQHTLRELWSHINSPLQMRQSLDTPRTEENRKHTLAKMAIHRGLISTKRSRSGRNSLSFLSVDLNLGELGRFMRQTIGTFSSDSDLAISANVHCEALVQRVLHDEASVGSCHGELENCVSILSLFLASSGKQGTEVPCTVVFEVQSLIGCIQDILKQHKLASLSYVRALWIASASSKIPAELLAITLHRLGRAYTEMGLHAEAQQILQKSLAEYSVANVHRNHAVIVDATELLTSIDETLELQGRLEGQKSKRWSSASARTLALIREDDVAERRVSM